MVKTKSNFEVILHHLIEVEFNLAWNKVGQADTCQCKALPCWRERDHQTCRGILDCQTLARAAIEEADFHPDRVKIADDLVDPIFMAPHIGT